MLPIDLGSKVAVTIWITIDGDEKNSYIIICVGGLFCIRLTGVENISRLRALVT